QPIENLRSTSALRGWSGLVLLVLSSSGCDPKRSSKRSGSLSDITQRGALLRLDVGRTDHLGPFLRFVGDQLPKFDGRERENGAIEMGDPGLDRGIGEAGIDLLVELVNNLGWRISWRAYAGPEGRLEAGHEITHGWNLRQRLRARRGGHRQGAKFAGS